MAAVDIAELVPWSEFRLPESPWEGTWGFNASILHVPDGSHPHAGRWLCNLRCANYHLPGSGTQANSTGSHNGVAQRIKNRNWLLELDAADGWNPIATHEIVDRSEVADKVAAGGPNAPNAHVLGYEDLRLAWSPTDGLIASATTMACNNDGVLEIAVLELSDDDFAIEVVQPLRGPWSGRHQKNWMPMLGWDRVKWLYSPEGGVHDRSGRLVQPGKRASPPAAEKMFLSAAQAARPNVFQHGAQTVQMMPGRAKVAPPRQTPLTLRGGTQLIPVPEIGPERWLGFVHACQVSTVKTYWHFAVLVGPAGDLLAMSRALKLSPDHGIEFAAGLARNPDGTGDQLVVTYGVEDDSARLAVTSASELCKILEPVE